ncbi:MAG: tetratricopeptide repeat protein [Planctomycetes bacterium]|nr:tetratricopeptide repeat protein [Planctomycetota bacterium]
MSQSTARPTPDRNISRWVCLWRMLVPSATAFFSGGCLMILILVASRLVARSVGSSLHTWTSVLGVVFAGISLGNYLGGRLADRYDARRVLAVLFGLSSAACVGILVSNNLADQWLWLWRLSWPGHVFLHVLLVFFPPSTLLGAVSPVVARMAVDRGPATGRAIGSIYAWGAVGAVVGTFLAGFFLIVAFGHAAIIWFLGVTLLILAILYWVSCWAMYLWAMVFLALLTMGMAGEPWAQEAGTAALLRPPPDPNVLYAAETPYRRVTIRQISPRPDRRVFVQDNRESARIVATEATHLAYFHLKVYAGLTRGLMGNRANPALLVLGAGGYAFPRYLRTVWPGSRVDVVEIDPGATQAATYAFSLDRDAALEVVHADARNYVDRAAAAGRKGTAPKRYDFLYQSALSDFAAPWPVLTKEFHERIVGLLADDGVYMVHLPDSCRSGLLLGAVVNTLRGTFPRVYVIVGPPDPASPLDTSVVVAARRPLDPRTILGEQNKHLRFAVLSDAQIEDLTSRCGHIILTDDYAPVENLLAPALRHQAAGILARRYLDEARALHNAHQYEPSIQRYHQALDTDPLLAAEAYEQIGLIHVARDRREEAARAFRRALQAHHEGRSRRTDVGSVHMHLGRLLGRLDRMKEAKEQWAQAVEAFRIELEEDPTAVLAWEGLGDTCAALGDYRGASDAFEQAAAREPRHPSHYRKLARALELQHRYDEAVAVVRRHIKLMQEQGRRDVVTQLSQYIELLQYKKTKHHKS